MAAISLKRVLISDPTDQIATKILTDHNLTVDSKPGLPKEELLKAIKDYDALIVRSGTQVTADVIEAGENLKVIGRAGVGVDNIDVAAAKKKGIVVINAPGGNTLSAAELTCCMIMNLSRRVPQACAALKGGKWDRKSYMGTELYGKTLAIVGLGRIGREVARRMQAFGMKTIGYDPLVPAEVSQTFGVTSYQLGELWPQADYITLHVPLIPATKHMVNDEVMKKCKKGVKIVNVARGGTIDEDALLQNLESKQVGGAGLDVFEEEPPKNTALLEHPLVVCSPHLGASTVEAQTKVAEEIALQFIDLTNGKEVPGKV